MMQVVFPTCDLPPTKITSKPSTSFLYRVPPKVDSEFDFAREVATASFFPFNRRKGSQSVTRFSSTEKRYSHKDVFNQVKPNRPVVRRWSNGFEPPVLGYLTVGDRPESRPQSNHTEDFIASKAIHIEDVVLRGRAAIAMPNKRFRDLREEYHEDPQADTTLLSLYTSPELSHSHTPFQQRSNMQPSTEISIQSIKTVPWSTWIKNRSVTATAQVCPDTLSKPVDQGISTSQNGPLSNKIDYASLSDISPRVPVKGILKSCSPTSRSPSLEDGENSGSTNTSKSLSSQGSKKRVQFLETDAVVSVPREAYGQSNMESNDICDVDRGVIDGYNATNEFTLCQKYDNVENGDDNKPQTMSNKMPFPKCKKPIVCASSDSKSQSEKNRLHPFSDRQKRNCMPVGFCKNGSVLLRDSPFGIHDKRLSGLHDLHAISCAPKSSTPTGTGAKNSKGSVIRLAHKFASLPKRSKSKHSSSPSQFSVPPFPSEAALSRVLMPPNAEVPRKTLRNGIQISMIPEKENNNLVQSGSWVSLKGPKNKGKWPSSTLRPKLHRQGDNFCSEEKTMRIMEWLDTVTPQGEGSLLHVLRSTTSK